MGWADRVLKVKRPQAAPSDGSGDQMFQVKITVVMAKLRRELKGPNLQPIVRQPVGQTIEATGDGETPGKALASAISEIQDAIGDGMAGGALDGLGADDHAQSQELMKGES